MPLSYQVQILQLCRSQSLFFCFLWPWGLAYRILLPRPRIEPRPSAVKGQSPNHWTTREFEILRPRQDWVGLHLPCFLCSAYWSLLLVIHFCSEHIWGLPLSFLSRLNFFLCLTSATLTVGPACSCIMKGEYRWEAHTCRPWGCCCS